LNPDVRKSYDLCAQKQVFVGRQLHTPEVIAGVTYAFDTTIRRCVAKIAFNYLAYVLSEDVQ
jgi:hypothetical protein